MGLLQKGQCELLLAQTYDLSQLTVSAFWGAKRARPGDWTLYAVSLGAQARVLEEVPAPRSEPEAGARHYTYPDSGHHNESGSLVYQGGSGGAEDATLIITPDQLPSQVMRVMFVLGSYLGSEQGRPLSKVRDASVRVLDAKGQEVVRYDIRGKLGPKGMHSLLFAELVRLPGGWGLLAIGDPVHFDSQIDLVQMLRDVPLIRPTPLPINRRPSPQSIPSPSTSQDNVSSPRPDESSPSAAAESEAASSNDDAPDCPFCKGKGCHFCNHTGKA